MNQGAMQPASGLPSTPILSLNLPLKEKPVRTSKKVNQAAAADQQIALDQKETSKQAQITGGYGVITLFDGVSS